MFTRINVFLLCLFCTSTALADPLAAAPPDRPEKSAELTRAMGTFDDVEATLAKLMADLPEVDLGRKADDAAQKDVPKTYELREYKKSPMIAAPRGFDLSAL